MKVRRGAHLCSLLYIQVSKITYVVPDEYVPSFAHVSVALTSVVVVESDIDTCPVAVVANILTSVHVMVSVLLHVTLYVVH